MTYDVSTKHLGLQADLFAIWANLNDLIPVITDIPKTNKDELMALWIAEQLYDLVQYETLLLSVVLMTEEMKCNMKNK